MAVHVSDLDAAKPDGSKIPVQFLDNHCRHVKEAVVTDFAKRHYNEDGSDKVDINATASQPGSPKDKNLFWNLSRGAKRLYVPSTHITYSEGKATTTLGSYVVQGVGVGQGWYDALPVSRVLGGHPGWVFHDVPALVVGSVTYYQAAGVFVSNASNTYTIRGVGYNTTTGESELLLTTPIAAADVQAGDDYSIRLLSSGWHDGPPIFAVNRPDGSQGPIEANGALERSHAEVFEFHQYGGPTSATIYGNVRPIHLIDTLTWTTSAQTVALMTLPAAAIVKKVYAIIAYEVKQKSGTVTSCKMEVGTSSDPDGFITSTELFGEANNTIIANDGAYLKDGSGHNVSKIFSVTATQALQARFTLTYSETSGSPPVQGDVLIGVQYRLLPTSQTFL
jgi:hypothetical protein